MLKSFMLLTPVTNHTSFVSKPSWMSVFLSVSIAAGGTIRLDSSGRLSLLDVIALMLLPITLPTLWKSSFAKRIALGLVLLQIAQTVSDLVNETRFISVPGLFGIQILSLVSLVAWLYDRRFSLVALIIGFGFCIVGLQVTSNQVYESNLWKYLLQFAVSIVTISFFSMGNSKRKLHLPLILSFICFFVLAIIYDYRAAAFINLMCLLFTLIAIKTRARSKNARGYETSWIKVPAFLLIGLVLYVSYPSLASTGFFGERAKSNIDSLKIDNREYLFIFEVRPELPYIVALSVQSPLIGRGSYGQPTSGQVSQALNEIERFVRIGDPNIRRWILSGDQRSGAYYLHSRIGQSILFGGFFTLLFWISALKNFSRISVIAFSQRLPSFSLALFCLLWFFWDSFFSPITVVARYEIALTVLIFYHVSRQIAPESIVSKK